MSILSIFPRIFFPLLNFFFRCFPFSKEEFLQNSKSFHGWIFDFHRKKQSNPKSLIVQFELKTSLQLKRSYKSPWFVELGIIETVKSHRWNLITLMAIKLQTFFWSKTFNTWGIEASFHRIPWNYVKCFVDKKKVKLFSHVLKHLHQIRERIVDCDLLYSNRKSMFIVHSYKILFIWYSKKTFITLGLVWIQFANVTHV